MCCSWRCDRARRPGRGRRPRPGTVRRFAEAGPGYALRAFRDDELGRRTENSVLEEKPERRGARRNTRGRGFRTRRAEPRSGGGHEESFPFRRPGRGALRRDPGPFEVCCRRSRLAVEPVIGPRFARTRWPRRGRRVRAAKPNPSRGAFAPEVSSVSPQPNEGDGAPVGATSFVVRRPLRDAAPSGAPSRRLFGPGRAFVPETPALLCRKTPIVRQPSSWRAVLLPPGGAPGPPGAVLARHDSGRCIPLRYPDASRRRPSDERDLWNIILDAGKSRAGGKIFSAVEGFVYPKSAGRLRRLRYGKNRRPRRYDRHRTAFFR